MPFTVSATGAREILDSRGRPTVHVRVELADGISGEASVPSGASTGAREAVELRDGDGKRYAGAGVRRAVGVILGEIATRLIGAEWDSLAEIDAALVELDGTPTKSRLGANAIVGVSMAAARALAARQQTPLHRWLADGAAPRLPVPHFNVINGGAHASNALDFQEFMIAPIGAPSMVDAVRTGAEIYATLRSLLADTGYSTGLGDEGGFAPDIDSPERACALLVDAIEQAGYDASVDGVAIALDPAASEFARSGGGYRVGGELLTSDDLIERYGRLIGDYPIWSLEDALSEDDDEGWQRLTARHGHRVQIVGDDLLVTSPPAIRRAIDTQLATAALIKLNQVGTVTETLEALRVCREAGWGAMISHRSGETPDAFIADLAVASGCGQIKAGAPARGERVAKYNRLMEIAGSIPDAPYGLR